MEMVEFSRSIFRDREKWQTREGESGSGTDREMEGKHFKQCVLNIKFKFRGALR